MGPIDAAKDRDDQPQNGAGEASSLWKFVVPSLMGISIFLIPIPFGDSTTIGMGAISDTVIEWTRPLLPGFVTFLVCLAATMSLIARVSSPRWLMDNPVLTDLFAVSANWTAVRVIGAAVALMILFQFGPEWIYAEATGGTILNTLAVIIVVYFFFAGILLPLLTQYGLMEFIGTLVRGAFRTVFALPGRASIDAVASWMGSAPVGVLITIQQYEAGYYSQREASVISTNFSVVSLAFVAAIASIIDVGHVFVPLYSTVVVAGLLAAVITPRLPPLRFKKDIYNEDAGKRISEDVPEDKTVVEWALQQAQARAANAPTFGQVLAIGSRNCADIWFGLLPAVMAIGTLSMVIAEYTPVFDVLAYPFALLLAFLRIPDAVAAAPAMVLGFADQFLPVLIGQGIETEMTRFVIACISVTQLIYMSEIGVLLLRSRIPLTLLDLAAIFLIRTLIVLPIIAVAAHLLY